MELLADDWSLGHDVFLDIAFGSFYFRVVERLTCQPNYARSTKPGMLKTQDYWLEKSLSAFDCMEKTLFIQWCLVKHRYDFRLELSQKVQ